MYMIPGFFRHSALKNWLLYKPSSVFFRIVHTHVKRMEEEARNLQTEEGPQRCMCSTEECGAFNQNLRRAIILEQPAFY